MGSQTFYLAKGGHRGFLLLMALTILCLIFELKFFAFLFFCFCVLWIVFFRDPDRRSPFLSSNAFLAPIDGKVTQLVFQDDLAIITIQVKVFDVGILRAPIAINNYHFSRIFGSPLLFSSMKTILSPQDTIVFEGHTMQITQNLFHFSPIEFSKDFKQGDQMGFLKAGEIKLTIKNIEAKVSIGDKLKGGESVIGYLQ